MLFLRKSLIIITKNRFLRDDYFNNTKNQSKKKDVILHKFLIDIINLIPLNKSKIPM